jgi:hypothetical protein
MSLLSSDALQVAEMPPVLDREDIRDDRHVDNPWQGKSGRDLYTGRIISCK